MLFQKKGKVIFQGDFNAYNCRKEGIIQPDKFDQDIELGKCSLWSLRNSEDIPTTDIRGEELLELCKAHNLIILNGRKTGDPWGNMISMEWKSCGPLRNYVL